jgi:type IV secretory pathway VirB10-like protein
LGGGIIQIKKIFILQKMMIRSMTAVNSRMLFKEIKIPPSLSIHTHTHIYIYFINIYTEGPNKMYKLFDMNNITL